MLLCKVSDLWSFKIKVPNVNLLKTDPAVKPTEV